MFDSVRPHGWQPTRLPHPWGSPGKNTGVGSHFLLQCMKVKSQSEVAQSCLTLSDPVDCSPPGSSVQGIFQARVLEWGAIAFSDQKLLELFNEFGKVSQYNINIQKSLAFLYTNNKISEREMKETIPLTITSKKKKRDHSIEWGIQCNIL